MKKVAIPYIFLSLMAGFSLPLTAADTRDSMQMVYAALNRLLPLALDEYSFDDEMKINQMRDALVLLEQSAADLSAHTGPRNLEFHGLARSFENNILLLRYMLDMERSSEFSYLALDLTQHCVSCHTRLPAASSFKMAADLTQALDKNLDNDLDLVQIEIATRQFDAALSRLEAMILDDGYEAIDLELDGVLFDYLSVGIQVTRDTQRISKTLKQFTDRPAIPYYMARYADIWQERLSFNETKLSPAATLDAARSSFNQATALSPIPNGQARLVDDMVTDSLLRRLLEGDTVLTDYQKSEIYWMMGVISIRSINPRPGVPHTEVLLDAAIRNAPDSRFARHAYALLEEFNRVSFAGIGVAELPDTLLNLAELRQLIEQ